MSADPAAVAGLRMEWRRGAHALEDRPQEWDALALEASPCLPMLSHAWVDAYAHALLPREASLVCGYARRGDRLVGVLPLVVRQERAVLGAACSASTPYHEHSAFGDALAAPGHADVVVALLASYARLEGARMREIALRGVVEGSTSALVDGASAARLRLVRTPRGLGSYLPVSGRWSDVRAGLSRNFRANLRKAGNRLEHSGLAPPRYLWLTADSALPSHLDAFLALEAGGWKGRAGTAIASQPQLRSFYARLAHNLHARGWLEWHLMLIGERIAAAHLGVRMRRRVALLKIAYDEELAHFSPGALLFQATAERAFERGDTDEIDCLTDMAWHRNWNLARRGYFDARWYPATVVGLGLGLVPRVVVDAARRVARHFTPPGRQRPGEKQGEAR